MMPWPESVAVPLSLFKIDLSPVALRLWCVLARWHPNIWPSNRRILECLPDGTSEVTLRRAKQELVDTGLLSVERRVDGRGRETSSLYTLMCPDAGIAEFGEGCETAPLPPYQTTPLEGCETTPPISNKQISNFSPSNEGEEAAPVKQKVDGKIVAEVVQAFAEEAKRCGYNPLSKRKQCAGLARMALGEGVAFEHVKSAMVECARRRTFSAWAHILADLQVGEEVGRPNAPRKGERRKQEDLDLREAGRRIAARLRNEEGPVL